MTNGDRIRSMTNEELARTLYMTCGQCVYAPLGRERWDCVKLGLDCSYGRARWLEQEEMKR